VCLRYDFLAQMFEKPLTSANACSTIISTDVRHSCSKGSAVRMHRTAIAAGVLTSVIVMLVVMVLASGFGVAQTQAIGQSAPAVLAAGFAVGLGTLVLNRELA
jgi:hypothetical protein